MYNAEGSRGPRIAIYSLLGLIGFLIVLIGMLEGVRLIRQFVARRETPPRPTTLQGWIRQLEAGPEQDARREAAREIVGRGPAAVAAALDATTVAPDDGSMLEISPLQEGNQFESVRAAKQLGRLGSEAVEAVPALTQALQHENKWLREAAADALGTLGREAGNVVPALQRVLEDSQPEVRAAAKNALEKIEGRRPS